MVYSDELEPIALALDKTRKRLEKYQSLRSREGSKEATSHEPSIHEKPRFFDVRLPGGVTFEEVVSSAYIEIVSASISDNGSVSDTIVSLINVTHSLVKQTLDHCLRDIGQFWEKGRNLTADSGETLLNAISTVCRRDLRHLRLALEQFICPVLNDALQKQYPKEKVKVPDDYQEKDCKKVLSLFDKLKDALKGITEDANVFSDPRMLNGIIEEALYFADRLGRCRPLAATSLSPPVHKRVLKYLERRKFNTEAMEWHKSSLKPGVFLWEERCAVLHQIKSRCGRYKSQYPAVEGSSVKRADYERLFKKAAHPAFSALNNKRSTNDTTGAYHFSAAVVLENTNERLLLKKSYGADEAWDFFHQIFLRYLPRKQTTVNCFSVFTYEALCLSLVDGRYFIRDDYKTDDAMKITHGCKKTRSNQLRLNPFDFDVNVLCVPYREHFSVAFIFGLNGTASPVILFADSLPGLHNPTFLAKLIRKYLNLLEGTISGEGSSHPYTEKSLPHFSLPVNKQPDGWSCLYQSMQNSYIVLNALFCHKLYPVEEDKSDGFGRYWRKACEFSCFKNDISKQHDAVYLLKKELYAISLCLITRGKKKKHKRSQNAARNPGSLEAAESLMSVKNNCKGGLASTVCEKGEQEEQGGGLVSTVSDDTDTAIGLASTVCEKGEQEAIGLVSTVSEDTDTAIDDTANEADGLGGLIQLSQGASNLNSGLTQSIANELEENDSDNESIDALCDDDTSRDEDNDNSPENDEDDTSRNENDKEFGEIEMYSLFQGLLDKHKDEVEARIERNNAEVEAIVQARETQMEAKMKAQETRMQQLTSYVSNLISKYENSLAHRFRHVGSIMAGEIVPPHFDVGQPSNEPFHFGMGPSNEPSHFSMGQPNHTPSMKEPPPPMKKPPATVRGNAPSKRSALSEDQLCAKRLKVDPRQEKKEKQKGGVFHLSLSENLHCFRKDAKFELKPRKKPIGKVPDDSVFMACPFCGPAHTQLVANPPENLDVVDIGERGLKFVRDDKVQPQMFRQHPKYTYFRYAVRKCYLEKKGISDKNDPAFDVNDFPPLFNDLRRNDCCTNAK